MTKSYWFLNALKKLKRCGSVVLSGNGVGKERWTLKGKLLRCMTVAMVYLLKACGQNTITSCPLSTKPFTILYVFSDAAKPAGGK
jgi:hypothetical protein